MMEPGAANNRIRSIWTLYELRGSGSGDSPALIKNEAKVPGPVQPGCGTPMISGYPVAE